MNEKNLESQISPAAETPPQITDEKAEEILKLLESIEINKETIDEVINNLKIGNKDAAFTSLNWFLKEKIEDKARRGKQREELQGKINSIISGESYQPPEGIKEATGVVSEVVPEVSRPAAEEKVGGVIERVPPQVEIKKSKAEIFRELTGLTKELERLQKRFLGISPKWENYQTKLINLNNRIENETLTKDLINEWQELKNEITQDIELEQEKGKQPEYREQKKKEQIDLRLERLDELKPQVELMLSKMAENKEIEEINKELNKLTNEINKLPSAEKLKEIDERIDQLTINFNEFIKNLRVADVPEEVKKFLAEKLKYFDIDQQEILDKLTDDELYRLQSFMVAGWNDKIIQFFKNKINAIIADRPDKELLTNDKIEAIAQSINQIIQETIENQARQELMKFDIKKAGKMALGIGKNLTIFGGSAILVSSLGLTGVGLAAGATITGQLIRYALEKRKVKKAETQEKYSIDLKEAKTKIRDRLLVDEKFKQKLSEIISTEIRRQTSLEARQTLTSYEKAKKDEVKEIPEKELAAIQQEFFLSALTLIKAEYPNFPQEQQEHMAYLMASTLSQHEQRENEAKKRLEELKKDNPKVIQWINKFNALRAGRTDKKPADITQSTWDKYKYETAALAIGTGVGIAIRLDPMARVIGGALAGAGAGLMTETYFGRKKQEKIFEEIESLIQEAEAVIRDIEFPANELPQLRTDATLVQSRLELGLLDTNPILKSRAENFIHQVRLVEFANQKVLNQLLLQQQENRKSLEEKMATDVSKIEKKTKFQRWAFFVGGAIAGAAGAFIFTDIREKLTGHYDLDDVFAKHHGEFKTSEDFYSLVNKYNLDNPSNDQLISVIEKMQGTSKEAELVRDLIEYQNLKGHPGGIWHLKAADGRDLAFKINNNGTLEMPDGSKISVEDLERAIQPQPLEGLKTEGIVDEEIKTGGPGVAGGVELEETEKVQTFSDVIKSSELGQGRHDSIWYSTNQMIVANAEELGFTGKPDELDHWAEVMTNKLVNDLDTRTTGGIKDLVHDGDTVFLEQKAGKWELGFKATSGIEPGHLPEIPEAGKIDLEKLRVEEITEPQLRTGYGYEIQELINERDNELNRLEAAYQEGMITDDQLASEQYRVTQQYEAQIDLYKNLSEARPTAPVEEITRQSKAELKEFEELGAEVKRAPSLLGEERVGSKTALTEAIRVEGSYQQAQEFLTTVDPAHSGKYELIIGKPDSPNTEMISFINKHPGLNSHEIYFIDHGVDLIRLKLSTNLTPETVYQIQKDGFRIKTIGKSEGIFNIDHTIIFKKGNQPAIFIDKDGNYGYRVAGELQKAGQINLAEINPTKLKFLEETVTRSEVQK